MTIGWSGCSDRRVAERPDQLDDVEALGDLADDRVVGRQADVLAGHDEELAPRRAGRLGLGLRHRDDALDVAGALRRRVDGRVARAAGARLGRVAALDDEAGDDAMEDRVVEVALLGE